MSENTPFRAGFVAVMGRPNVGKSTLVNALLGEKVSICSPKPQTTRHRVHGIVQRPHAQTILVDTPGLGDGSSPLVRALRRTACGAAADADATLVVLDVAAATPALTDADVAAFRAAARAPGPLVVALNKMDLARHRNMVLPWMEAAAAASGGAARAIVPVSARRRENLGPLLDALEACLPQSPALYPADMHTDQPERALCGELVREQLLLLTQQEVPHSATVVIDGFADGRDDDRPLCRIDGRIVVERDSQKAIVIGRGGAQIRAIGSAARPRIEAVLGCQVHLALRVAVDPRWTRNPDALSRYGLAGEAR